MLELIALARVADCPYGWGVFEAQVQNLRTRMVRDKDDYISAAASLIVMLARRVGPTLHDALDECSLTVLKEHRRRCEGGQR